VRRHGRNVIKFTNAVGKRLNTTFETGYHTKERVLLKRIEEQETALNRVEVRSLFGNEPEI
jgi:hypothetical protein